MFLRSLPGRLILEQEVVLNFLKLHPRVKTVTTNSWGTYNENDFRVHM